MPSLVRRVTTWLLVLLAIYAAVVLLFALLQDSMVFPRAGAGDRGIPELPGTAAVTVGTLQRGDGGRSRIITLEPLEPVRGVALWFVGNGEDLTSAARGGVELVGYGLVVLGVEHPGYGSSDGPVGVATFLAGADAAAAHGAALAEARGVPLVAVGSSLGTFCAVHVAAQGRVERLLLRSPPTSLSRAAKARFFWLPIDLFLRHSFDNIGKARLIRCPTLILHGDRDGVVPMQHGRDLAAAIGEHAEFVPAAGCGHNDLSLDRDGPHGRTIARFLAGG